MKKLITILLSIMSLSVITFSHKHKAPTFEKSKTYAACDLNKNLPIKMTIGTSEGKDMLYIPGYGRVFLVKTDYGYQDVNNNFNVFVMGDKLRIGANVTMFDLNYTYPERYKKGEFYHSFAGYLHSHIHPMVEKNVIKIGEVEYNVVKSVDKFSESTLYTEENGKFTVLFVRNLGKEKSPMPNIAEFKFTADLCPTK